MNLPTAPLVSGIWGRVWMRRRERRTGSGESSRAGLPGSARVGRCAGVEPGSPDLTRTGRFDHRTQLGEGLRTLPFG